MNKTTKIILILLIFIATIALFFAVYQKTDIINKQETAGTDSKAAAPVSISPKIKTIEQKYESVENQYAKEIKIDNEIYELALAKNNKELCLAMFNDRSRDICVKHVAVQLLDTDLCQAVSVQEEKDNCFNEVILAKAENNKDLLLCEQVTDEMLRLTCLERIIAKGIIADDCEQIPLRYSPRTPENNNETELRDLCVSKVLHKQALADNNEALCEQIPLRYIMAKCLGKLKPIPLDSDNDNDGLNYYEEIIYNTNPDTSDTDGDGYSDGEEVEAGYNPKGEGRL